MAKFLSQIYTVIRGSVGGITYTANQFAGLIARAKTAPVNPNTSKQTAIRSAFANASTLWVQLSQIERDLWNDYADTLVYQGPLGSYSVPGRLVFIGNLATAQFLNDEIGQPAVVLTTPPPTGGFLNVGGVLPEDYSGVAATGIQLRYQNDEAVGIVGYVERSFAFNGARNRFKGPFLSDTLVGETIIAGAAGSISFIGLVEAAIYFTRPRFISAAAPFKMSAPSFLRHIANTTI